MVYVLNIDGKPLMPCKEAKARKLLKDNLARIVKYEPFTIQLIFECENQTQDCTLGIDCGSKHIGLAVNSENGKVLYTAEVILRQDIKDNLESRKRLRRSRRNRKTRYRKARFLNRKRYKGWLPPSIRSRLDSHIKVVNDIVKILPITNIRAEIGQFDTQAIMNPDIQGEEYQQGQMCGYDSVKEFVKIRDNYTCHYAKLRPDIPCSNQLTVDHLIPKSKRGTDRPDNLVCCCSEHNRLKTNLSYKEFTGKKLPKVKNLKETVFMNVLKDYLIPRLKEIRPTQYTFGLYTRRLRNEWELEKTHINDAITITKIQPNEILCDKFTIKQFRKKKRSLHEETARKGRKEPNRDSKRNDKNTKYSNGFYLNDKVKVFDKIGFISGFCNGGCYVKDIEDNYITIPNKSYKQVGFKNLELINHNNNWQFICTS